MDTIPPQPVPPLPEVELQMEVEAVVNAFASGDVRESLEAWRSVIRDVIAAVGLIDLERDARERNERSGVDFGQLYRTLMELRPVEREARETLSRRVSSELRHAAE